MKKIILFIVALLILNIITHAQSYSYLGTFNTAGVPNYLDTRDTVPASLLARVSASLPESYPVPTYNPQYIATGTQTDITLNDSADVWVTFVGEGAGYKNVLGYYTYNKSNPPTSVPSNANIKIIFPNVSANGSGGGLYVGDRVKIGRFPPNTGIGWVLLANGYQNNRVTSGYWRVFSNPDFNPENDTTLRYHNVLLRDSSTNCIVLGFEDIRRDYRSCDQDFNDAIFYVKSNPVTAIDTANINRTTPGGQGVSSGNNGGLESHSGLSQIIGKRNIDRAHSNYQVKDLHVEKNALKNVLVNSTSNRAVAKGTSGINLLEYVPENIIASTNSYVSSPTDLIGITTATDVLSVDYMKNNNVVAAMLATLTEGQVYDHTKVICDRLKGAELRDVKIREIGKYQYLQSCIVRPSSEVEYAISFSLVPDGTGKYQLESLWNLSDYSKGYEVINIQVWSQSPAYTQEIITQVLNKLSENLDIKQDGKPELPAIYVQKAYYSAGEIKMQIKNLNNVTDLEVDGVISESETKSEQDYVRDISLSGSNNETITLKTDYIFDAGFAIKSDNKQIDFLYQADGQWGLDYQKENTVVENFTVQKNTALVGDGSYLIERSISIQARTNDYVSAYRFFKPNGQVMDIAEYNSLKIDFDGSEELKVTLMISGMSWQEYPNVLMSTDEKELSLKEFGNYDPKKVTGLIFTPTIEEGKVNLNINKLSLSADDVMQRITDNQLHIYPNPVVNKVHISSKVEKGAMFYIRDLTGKVITKNEYTKTGIDVSSLMNGVYILEQTVNSQKKSTKFVLMR